MMFQDKRFVCSNFQGDRSETRLSVKNQKVKQHFYMKHTFIVSTDQRVSACGPNKARLLCQYKDKEKTVNQKLK